MKHAHPSPLMPTSPVPSGCNGSENASRPRDQEAQTALLTEMATRHLGALYRTALRLTRHRQEAEDLVQETYLRAWRSLHTYEPGTNSKAWLLKILRNSHIDRSRASARTVKTTDEVEEHARLLVIQETPESLFMARRIDAEVRQALMEIPEVFRACVILADLRGVSHLRIMDMLGIPRGTVMSRLFRGRRAVRRLLTAYGREHGYLKAG
jgi:RNA polymerase sigma-70 factor, ECF subfamily